MVLGCLGYTLQRETVSWSSGVKITSRSYRSPQPGYQGSGLKLERVFREPDVNIYFRSPRSSYAKMSNILTMNARRHYRKRSKIAEYIQTRAPTQLPSQENRRFLTKMRDRQVYLLIVVVTFLTADIGKLFRCRFYINLVF